MKIDVLTINDCPNSRAFNCPLLVARPLLEGHGVSLRFRFGDPHRPCKGDAIFINSRVFKEDWQRGQDSAIYAFLERAKRNSQRTFWFDTTDSTWCTQFGVLPYVDRFLKSQVFVDLSTYLKPFRTGRIYTDTFDALYACGEPEETYPVPKESDLGKIDVSWNTCFENYLESRHGLRARIKQRLRPYICHFVPETLAIRFAPVENRDRRGISCRVGLAHSRPAVAAHRRAIIERLAKRNVECGKIPLEEYFRELRQSQIGIGPFGVGEITLRDFEIIACGAALVKPDMGHLRTWPDLFRPNETYFPHRWDLDDFESLLDALEAEPERCHAAAKKAKESYRNAVAPQGMEHFAERLVNFTGRTLNEWK
jgi:hypothetical protein